MSDNQLISKIIAWKKEYYNLLDELVSKPYEDNEVIIKRLRELNVLMHYHLKGSDLIENNAIKHDEA